MRLRTQENVKEEIGQRKINVRVSRVKFHSYALFSFLRALTCVAKNESVEINLKDQKVLGDLAKNTVHEMLPAYSAIGILVGVLQSVHFSNFWDLD